MLTPLPRILAGLATATVMLAWSAQAYAQSSRLIQSMDTNKDGKVSRDEIPEGSATRRMFDNMVDKYKLDPKKTYTIAELEQINGLAVSGTSSSGPGNSGPPSRSNGARRSFGAGSGSVRTGPPSRAPTDGRPFRALEELPEPYRAYDKDGDGQIGLYEWPRDRIRDFIALDLNDDGFLTINELRRPSIGGTSKEAPKEKNDEPKKDETASP